MTDLNVKQNNEQDATCEKISLKLHEAEEDETANTKPSPSIEKPPALLFSKRLLVTVMLFFSFIAFQILRNNVNIAVVEMTSNKSIVQGNQIIIQPPEFNWDSPTIALIISILNYGGLFSFFNGFLINKLGASKSCAICMLLCGITTILHPASLQQGFHIFLACRFLTGILEAVFYASTAEIASKWFPLKERSTLIGYSYNGVNVGVAIVYPICGYLAHEWGWRMVFYVTGIGSVIISIIFLALIQNHPTQDTKISKAELEYILWNNETAHTEHKTGGDITKAKIFEVFKQILTSAPIWALLITTFIYMWMATVVTGCLPLYIKDLTGKESDEVGYISSIPNCIYLFMVPIAGALMDIWKNNYNITITAIHKIVLSTAQISATIFFITATLVSNLTITLVFFVLIQICTCFIPLITPILTVCLAPKHVSHVSSLSVISFSAGGIIAQTVAGFLTTNHSLEEWNNCFFLTAAMTALGAVIFLIFGSSEAQPWSVESSSDKHKRCSLGENLQITEKKLIDSFDASKICSEMYPIAGKMFL